MKITSTTTRYGAYITEYDFSEEVWLEFKDTMRDDADFPDHDDDIRFEYQDEFVEWLQEQLAEGDTRITTAHDSPEMTGDTTKIEWSN
jgi:hypothetical protein